MNERDYLMSLLDYDSSTGVFRWKCKRRGIKRSKIAGMVKLNGYNYIMVNYKEYKASNLAWLFVHGKWPINIIDHINGIKTDDSIENLRDVTYRANSNNTRRHREGKTAGTSYRKDGRKYPWIARIRISRPKNILIHLGSFKTEAEAHEAYMKAYQELENEQSGKKIVCNR